MRALIGPRPAATARRGLPPLPAVLRRGELAAPYVEAERRSDHRRAGAAASAAAERALEIGAWWPADAWAHRALWHFEQVEMSLAAVRAARRIGDIRVAAGDPASARRYYAEAIDEGRDIGAEREEGRAALGMARAELGLANVAVARRLGSIALDLFERAGGSEAELAEAREIIGQEKEVG